MFNSLFKRATLTISRADGSGYYNNSGDWVDNTTSDFPIQCNIQPFRSGDTQVVLPEGITVNDALIIYTASLVQTSDQFSGTKADETLIDGKSYVAFNIENWTRNSGFRQAHYKVLFVRKDKLPNGGL